MYGRGEPTDELDRALEGALAPVDFRHQSASHDHRVGVHRHRSRLLGRGDPEPDGHRNRGGGPDLGQLPGKIFRKRRPRTGHTGDADEIQEAPGARSDGAEALRWRGAQPVFVTCSAYLPICDIANRRVAPPMPCDFCSTYVDKMVAPLHFPLIRLSSYMPAEERRDSLHIATFEEIDDFHQFGFGRPLLSTG